MVERSDSDGSWLNALILIANKHGHLAPLFIAKILKYIFWDASHGSVKDASQENASMRTGDQSLIC